MRASAWFLLTAGLALAWPAPALGAKTPAPTASQRAAAANHRRPVLRGGRSVKIHPDWASHPSARYAAMDAPTCRAELARRAVEFTVVPSAPGVLAPLRLPKDVGGVTFHTAAPAHLRAVSPFEVFDCRLVLTLHDWSPRLRAHEIDEVVLFSAWRPPLRSAAAIPIARRHPGALAIDASRFVKRAAEDGGARAALDVERDFHGTLGAPPCGTDAAAPRPDTPEARELRSIVCEAVDQHLFTVILTPNYDRNHRNHFHLELTADVPWYLVR